MWSVWIVFCDCGFHSVCPLMEKDKRLMEASWWERLTEGEIGFCSDGPCSVYLYPIFYWWVGCWHDLLFDMSPNYGGGNEDNGKRSHAFTAAFSALDPAGGHCQPMSLKRFLDTHGLVWVSLLWGHFSFLLGPGAHKVLFVPSKSLHSQSCITSWLLSPSAVVWEPPPK